MDIGWNCVRRLTDFTSNMLSQKYFLVSYLQKSIISCDMNTLEVTTKNLHVMHYQNLLTHAYTINITNSTTHNRWKLVI